MKPTVVLIALLSINFASLAQPDFISEIFPKGTVLHQNIPYANDTLKKHRLDIYLPGKQKGNSPLIIWVHGGAWMFNDKYADMGYMKNTIRALVEKGYALASIDYRHSTTVKFPAQLVDCSMAVQFLFKHAGDYHLDGKKFILMGFSAGGHLASLLGLSLNNNVKEFSNSNDRPLFKIKAVIDFYGPSNFLLFFGNADPEFVDNPIAILLGVSPLKRPDISAMASPVTYVDKNDPPFFIVHGEKDDQVPLAQSHLLKSYLDLAGVKNDFTIVKDAPHFGEMFDTDDIRSKLIKFLEGIVEP
jgi:acetyl esterase/lipase